MSVTVTKQHFEGREQAIRCIEAQGLYARDGAMQAGNLEDIHWHKTSLLIYVLSGSFETYDAAADKYLTAAAFDLISIPARTLHAARCPEPATYMVGFESAQAARSFRPEKSQDLSVP